MVIDACEGHGIGTFDAPGAYLHAKLPKGKHAGRKTRHRFLYIMHNVNIELTENVV